MNRSLYLIKCDTLIRSPWYENLIWLHVCKRTVGRHSSGVSRIFTDAHYSRHVDEWVRTHIGIGKRIHPFFGNNTQLRSKYERRNSSSSIALHTPIIHPSIHTVQCVHTWQSAHISFAQHTQSQKHTLMASKHITHACTNMTEAKKKKTQSTTMDGRIIEGERPLFIFILEFRVMCIEV